MNGKGIWKTSTTPSTLPTRLRPYLLTTMSELAKQPCGLTLWAIERTSAIRGLNRAVDIAGKVITVGKQARNDIT
jgi:hypothetical protein